jgi:hypothetical protein
MPPGWSAVAEQLHWPLASVEQVAVFQPTAVKPLAILEHSTGTDETVKHESLNGNAMEPVVVVLSVYVPLPLAVHVPSTCRDPVTGTVLHPTSKLTSQSPDKVRQDDVTFQVPTGWPPLPELPLLAEEPPRPAFPPEFPPELLPAEPPFAVVPLEPPVVPPEPPVVPPEPPLPPEVEDEHAAPRIQNAAMIVCSEVRCVIDSP